MTLKSDAKFEEKLTLGSKNDIKNLVNFNASSGKSENLHFYGLLLQKVCTVMFELKKYRQVVSLKMAYGFIMVLAYQILTFWTFHCLSEVVQNPHVIFETRSQFLYKLCTIL